MFTIAQTVRVNQSEDRKRTYYIIKNLAITEKTPKKMRDGLEVICS